MSKSASELIEEVVVYLLTHKGVFYASLLSLMKRIPLKEVGTCGVTVKNGRILLYYNPEFIESLKTIKERRALLEHEVLHLVMDHHGRRKDRDPELWNCAGDIAINQLIDGLPKDRLDHAILDPKWNVPKKSHAEVYYDILKKNQKKVFIKCGCGKSKNGKNDGKGKDGKGCSGCEYEIKDSKGKTIGKGKLIDNHDKWDECDGHDITKEVIKQAVKEAKEQSEKHQGQGHMPNGLEEYIDELLKPAVIPWQTLLKRWVATKIKAGHKSSWKRPNRRFGDVQKGHIPTRKLAITVAIDTSGSISNEDLQDFVAEIKSIQKSYKTRITILECDAGVQKEYVLNASTNVQLNFKGRGGTSFVPVFEHIEETNIKTDLLIYFTDMYGDFPDEKPRYPTLWIATNDDYKDSYKVPFGDVLSIQDHTSAGKRKR